MRTIVIIIFVLMTTLSFSQGKVELLNKGNEYFQEGDFKQAENYYKQSFEKDNNYYKSNLNTGHALFRQAAGSSEFREAVKQKLDSAGLKKCSEAELFYKNSIKLAKNKNNKSESLYHLGNSQLLSKDLENAIENYKKSLRLVPENMDAKYNLALAQYLLNKENKKESKGGGENEEEKEKNEEEKGEEDALRKEEMEQVLKALEREETKIQEDVQKKKLPQKKTTLKDW